MTPTPIRRLPGELVEFLVNHIDSLEELEILTLLSDHPRPWTVDEVDEVIRSSAASLSNRLGRLCTKGLLVKTSEPAAFQFAPQDEPLRNAVLLALSYYKTHRIQVVEVIFQKPDQKIQIFSDAFKWGGKNG